MSNVRKTLQMTRLLFGMTILFCFIAWSLGYEGFIIVGHIELPLWFVHIITFTLLTIDFALRTGFTLNMYSWKALYLAIPMAILSKIGSFYLP